MTSCGRRVLLPVDDSEHAERAFHWFIENSWKKEDKIIFIHCAEPLHLSAFSLKQPLKPPTDEWNEQVKAKIESCDKLKDKFDVECSSIKANHEFYQEDGKNPGETIVKFIHENDITTVVIGNRGLGKVRRTFLGSVSDYIVHHANIPVTIVPPKK